MSVSAPLRTALLLAATACVVSACSGLSAHSQSALNHSEMPPAIDANGVMVGTVNRMTLYTFDHDSSTASACQDACAEKWPPLYAPDYAVPRGDFGVINRHDGKKQWTLANKPLYFFSQDIRPGDKNGDNAKGLWHVFRIEQAGQ